MVDGSEAVTLRVAMNDYAGLVLLPRLLARLAKLAPAVTLDIRPFPSWAEVASQTSALFHLVHRTIVAVKAPPTRGWAA